ncbi:hypothetical protein TrST_g12773 [Triparma strigata]|uniref:Potassium channel domain-containing protein n=1 Tax=Triparma strigata TaxID=1606541 RepID=A0A9W7A210_9STRA|nr:hypothetical protein TrST_g12773 [Triparma strigata]
MLANAALHHNHKLNGSLKLHHSRLQHVRNTAASTSLRWTRRNQLSLWIRGSPLPIFFLSLAFWLISGAFVYSNLILSKPSNFIEGLFFTVESGLGVGFGLLQMSSTPYRLLGILYSMIGATFILATLTLWINSAEVS